MNRNFMNLDISRTRFGSLQELGILLMPFKNLIVQEFDYYLNDLDKRLIDLHKTVKFNYNTLNGRIRDQSDE